MTQQDQYMLMFSLGPVQTFIAQARKTRDLWLGSYLLAILMEAAMRGMDNVLVYPTTPILEKDSNLPDLPNKYVALFDDLEVAKKAAEDSNERISSCWKNICKDAWEQTIRRHPDKESIVIAHQIWLRQTNPEICFDIFWVIVERKPSEGYGTWLERTEKAFDARKRLRDFKIPHNLDDPSIIDEHGEKSTISGEREALRGKDASPDGVRTFWKELTEVDSNGKSTLSIKDISPNGKERLDAIDMVKRFAYRAEPLVEKGVNAGFPSTSSIATASFVEKLLTAEIKAADLQAWLDITSEPRLMQDPTYRDAIPYFQQPGKIASRREDIVLRDGDLYFPETFTAYRLREDYNFPYTTAQEKRETELYANKSSRALKALLHTADSQGITLPTPYYALIQMDGDKMGTLLSGIKGDKEEHKAISEALSKFARTSALNIVQEQYPGRLVYAGGDDVFALAPLARDVSSDDGIVTVLDLVNQLQQEYNNTVAKPVLDANRKKNVTVSTGIAIAHHYTSLSYVRRLAKSAEELAKDHYGRNALVVTIIRRSGEQTRIGCHWHYPGLQMQPIQLFTYFYQLFKHDVLSPKSIYNLLEEAPALVKLGDAQRSEFKRMLQRRYDGKREDKLPTAVISIPTLAKHLVELANAMDSDEKRKHDTTRSAELHSDERRYGLVEVLGWLLVTAFLARKEQE